MSEIESNLAEAETNVSYFFKVFKKFVCSLINTKLVDVIETTSSKIKKLKPFGHKPKGLINWNFGAVCF